MARTYIRDSHMNIIAWVEDTYDGGQRLYNAHGRFLGAYDVRSNTTTNEHHSEIYPGNVLLMLLQ